MKLPTLSWPTAVLLSVVVAALAAAYLAGPSLGVPEESHTAFVAGVGAVGALLLAGARALFSKDADHDGSPALLDANDNDPEVQ